ncbi:MAG TPA: ABC transporter ATP-binding protein [Rhodanobacteraceae bacterium]|nr:ABC transporter ATP-binding protein [Rhodanobacteraceae bacterium]
MTGHEDTAADTSPHWLQDLGKAARAWRDLAQAQWQLLEAELRLARSAARITLLAMLMSAAFAAALALTLLALLGVALSQWLGSWAWALLVLIGLLALGLVGVRMLFRRCLHWMSLPNVRASWRGAMTSSTAEASDAGARAASPGDGTAD